MTTYRKSLPRRTVLRGAGSVAIALPFLDEMRVQSVYAADPEPPPRLLTMFFGEGCPITVQNEHLGSLTGPFEPLAVHSDKLGFCRGLRFPDEHHYGGGSGVFTGVGQVGSDGAQTMGPSIDQVLLAEAYPQGLPAGVLATLAMALIGTYHPDNGDPAVRFVKCWNDDGNPVTIPRFNPQDLFTSIFGEGPGDGSAEEEKRKRRAKSILDGVVGQYQHLTSEAGGLGAQSRARISDHLERVREYEQQAFGDISALCDVPPSPPLLPLVGEQLHHAGIIYDINEFSAVWRQMADLYALAVHCDLVRFGNAHFLNVGDRINFQGDYVVDGEVAYTFDDYGNTPGEADLGTHVNHEHFHAWNGTGSPVHADWHLHFYMRELAYLLTRLDDTEYADENGGTVLDNATILISTELSDPGPHLSRDVFHAYSGGNDRFATGTMVTATGDPQRPAADFYNTILEAYGVERRMGSGEYEQVTQVLK
ncbi:MAG: DUF1552 domain-containing protein [Myxococcota bacterium]